MQPNECDGSSFLLKKKKNTVREATRWLPDNSRGHKHPAAPLGRKICLDPSQTDAPKRPEINY